MATLALLDRFAGDEPLPELRARATRLAASLRARAEAERRGPGDTTADDRPLRLAPEGTPLERR